MSKNFELLQQAEAVAPASSGEGMNAAVAARNGKTNGNGNGAHYGVRDAATREESLKLVQNVFLPRNEASPRVVVFAGINSGDGCSWVCSNVAEALAGQRVGTVCLVDANLRSPVLPDLFGVGNHYGLTDALTQKEPIREFAKVVRADNLWLLSCGSHSAESAGPLNSEMMKLRIAELRREFDFVLIDSSPLSNFADGVALGQLADGMVLVLGANTTRREAAAKVTETLRAAQIKVLGAVLNKRTFPIPETLYKMM